MILTPLSAEVSKSLGLLQIPVIEVGRQFAEGAQDVFAANHVLAEGAWRPAQELGLRIPDDLSLVSFDDAAWTTTVRPEAAAVAQMFDRIENPRHRRGR